VALEKCVAERGPAEKITGVAAYVSFGDPGPAIEAFAGKVGSAPEDPSARRSHLPTRRRERKMQRFKSPSSAQKLLSTHAAVFNTFNVQRHLSSAQTHCTLRTAAMSTWREVVAAA
jgi:hypothetical protein